MYNNETLKFNNKKNIRQRWQDKRGIGCKTMKHENSTISKLLDTND